jgi:formate-dependent nitrite reductase membrane component NrfD
VTTLLTDIGGAWAVGFLAIAVTFTIFVIGMGLIFARIALAALTKAEPNQVSEVIYSLAELAGQLARWSPRTKLDGERSPTGKEVS